MVSSSFESDTIEARWRRIHQECPDLVNVLAVSKGHSAMAVRELADIGQIDFGESRVQEALPKQQELSDISQLRWHFIGRLQSNKVRAVVRAFPVIHSIDSQELAERTSRIALEEDQIPEVFFQVKLRDDSAKGGLDPFALREIWPRLQSLPGLKPIGLMTMAPLGMEAADRQNLFHDCRTLADELGLPDCSMGMSGDWQLAARAGATWVRLGSGLFGPRPERSI